MKRGIKMSNARKMILAAVATVALLSGIAPAYADKGGNGHGKGKWSQESDNSYVKRSYDRNDNTTSIRIYDNDRVVLHRYAEDHYKKSCPPGLAKKHNGCLPPGQAKKRFAVGHHLPDDVVYYTVPHDVVIHLKPVPSGYQYVRVDNDVLLMNQATKMIVDAVTLMSAIGGR